jgi:hypothetical protein
MPRRRRSISAPHRQPWYFSLEGVQTQRALWERDELPLIEPLRDLSGYDPDAGLVGIGDETGAAAINSN